MTETTPHDLPALAALSARIGADPMLVQAAGGNTSIKDGGTLWIKASGTLLADALARDIFVPCDLPAMRAALDARAAEADQPARFALGASALRPSIETSLHAVFPQRVVLHVHCVHTLAHAIRADAQPLLAARLGGYDWALVPYVKPGATLAARVAAARRPGTDVVILGNHGLIVAAETVQEAGALLDRVHAALAVAPRALPGLAELEAPPGWTPLAPDHPLHGVARNPALLAMATGRSLWPDHVIFLGPSVPTVESAGEGAPLALAPGAGGLMRKGASAGAHALARCLGDVLARLPDDARLTTLTAVDEAALLDWDAEKYRKTLNV